MSMLNLQELIGKTKEMEQARIRLEAAEPCSIHGKARLVICEHCLETIQCEECSWSSCECTNDE